MSDQEDRKSESLSDLCLALCQLIKARSSVQQLRECARAISELCNNSSGVRGRAKLSLKIFAVKGSPELADLVSAFEACRDACALLGLLSCVDSFLNIPRNLRRIRLLVAGNAVFSLIKCCQYFIRNGENEFVSDGCLDHLIAVLLTIALKDRRSGLKLRLSGFLQQTVMEVCRAGKDTPCCLLDLLIFAARSGRNAVVMGKQKDFIPWLLGTLDSSSTHFSLPQVKRNSQLLFYLSRTKKNRQRMLGLGSIPILLKLFKSYIDTKDQPDYAEICLVTLGCLKQLGKTKAGKDQLVSANGLSVCEEAIRNCSADQSRGLTCGEAAALRELHRSLCALCMRCLPSAPYPLATAPFPITFPLPTEAKSLQKPGEDSAESDDDEMEDEEMDVMESEDENESVAPERNKKAKGDFSQYEKFFWEFSHDLRTLSVDGYPAQSSSPVFSVRARPSTGTKLLKKKRSFSVGSEMNNLVGDPKKGGRIRMRTNSAERKATNTEQKKAPRKVPGNSTVKRTGVNGGRVKSGKSKGEGRKSSCGPMVDEETYMRQARLTASVMPFVKVAYPDWKMAFPDLPLQTLKDFPRAVEQNVLADVQKYQETSSFTARIVFDLDALLKLDRIRSANGSKSLKNTDMERIGNKDPNCDHLKFESRFESGNLRRAVQTGPYEYELHLSPDINQLSQHFQWFYFETSNMDADIPYSFKIVNCLKSHSMFSNGMQPVLFSVTEASEGRPGWVRAGHGVCYYRNLYTQQMGKKASETRGYYSVAFSITFRHPADVCYVAYHFPYTYTMLQCQLSAWRAQVESSVSLYCRVDELCQTLSGNEVNLLTITAQGSAEEVKRRDVIFLSARVHPGEANANWMMLGSIRFLLSDHPKAATLRKCFVFKIVPMLNPDGVINGSHRCSLVGQDLNRQWGDPNPTLHPTIYHSKAILSYLESCGRTPVVFCDFHGHSRRCNVFVYGNNPEESWWVPDHATENKGEFLEMPQILDAIAPAFSLNDCRFVVEKGKEPSARVATWRQFGIKRAYTMESTYCGFDKGPYAGFHTGTRELAEMGERFCEALVVLRDRLNATDSRDATSSSSEADD